MGIEQAYQRKKNIIEELKDDMEKCFGQATTEKNGGGEYYYEGSDTRKEK